MSRFRLAVLSMLAGLLCVSASCEVTGLDAATLAEIAASSELPSGKYTLVRLWEAEGPDIKHTSGRAVSDPDASGGQAWEVLPTEDEPGAVAFGPYFETTPGDYVALFRVKVLTDEAAESAAVVDACTDYARNMLASRELSAGDLVANRYRRCALGFRYKGGKLECRVNWDGFYGLRIDSVALYRLEGGSVLPPGRAKEPKPSGEPRDIDVVSEPRPFPDIFPRSNPPAKDLLVCDLRKQPADLRLLLLSLQGLVNRQTPRLYCLSQTTDPQWLQHLQDRKWIDSATPIANPEDLLTRFRDVYRGLIVYDPRLPASKNVATMLASVRDGLVASPRLAKRLGLPVIDDLQGRWSTSVDAYRWAFDNLWPQLNHHVIACSWPEHLGLRDYLVQNRVFIFWISGALDGARKYASPDAEVRLMEELLAKMPVNIPVMSYPWAGKDVGIGEGPGVSLFAEFGKYLVGSIECSNLSVHSGVRVESLKQKPAPPAPDLQPDKVYVSYIMSDGDNLPVLTGHNFPQLWQDPLRGRFPIGWTLSPAASVLIPDIVDWYYSKAGPNDPFLGAVSGVGYTYPDLYGQRYRDRQAVYDGFLDQTAEYMQRADLKSCWIMNATRPEIISRYAERIPFLEALFPDYGRRVLTPRDMVYPTARNVPVFHAIGGWRQEATREERLKEVVAEVRRFTPTQRPGFMHLFVLNWFADLPLLEQIVTELGPGYVFVRPDHLATLYTKYLAGQKLLVRFPEVALALKGQPLVLEGSVRNVSPTPADCALQVTGLNGPRITPGTVTLAPSEESRFRVSGTPETSQVTLSVRTGERTTAHTVQIRQVDATELADELPKLGGLVPGPFLEARQLAHVTGSDKQVEGAAGLARVAEKGVDEPGHMLYGPYATLEKGKYLVLFRLKRTGEGTGTLVELDTCVGGGTPQTGLRSVDCSEAPLGTWRCFALVMDHPGGAYETRALWPGKASVAIDWVGLWSIRPTDEN